MNTIDHRSPLGQTEVGNASRAITTGLHAVRFAQLNSRAWRRWRRNVAVGVVNLFLAVSLSYGGVVENLDLLRYRCLRYAVGFAPNDDNTRTIRHGLWAQSPFSPAGEIDLAASGFSLAAIPAAVGTLMSSNFAYTVATNASEQIRMMVEKSAAASSPTDIQKYGFAGMLFHYYVWNDAAGEFQGKSGSEISSIDTALLMYGLMVCANYFGGQVMEDYEAARDAIRWRDWLDETTQGHQNQFRMAYNPGSGFAGWWDWYSHETMLICLFACMSDPAIDPAVVWRAWRRAEVTYVSPPPDSKTFTCFATYFGDPFTVFYGLAFLDLSRFPADLDGVNWFRQGQTAYQGHVEFFKKERGYLDNTSLAFVAGASGVIAKPKSSPDSPILRNDCAVYSVVGGLSYYSPTPASNELAQTLSLLINTNSDFFDWHGWPVSTVNATNINHPKVSNSIIGQDISLIAVAIDNYLTNRIQNIALQDQRLSRILNRIFPPRNRVALGLLPETITLESVGIPFTACMLQQADVLSDSWTDVTNLTFSANGETQITLPTTASSRFFRLRGN